MSLNYRRTTSELGKKSQWMWMLGGGARDTYTPEQDVGEG